MINTVEKPKQEEKKERSTGDRGRLQVSMEWSEGLKENVQSKDLEAVGEQGHKPVSATWSQVPRWHSKEFLQCRKHGFDSTAFSLEKEMA